MIIDRSKVIDTFKAYTSHYDDQNEKVRLKIEHTYRVSELCEKIAQSLNLSPEDVNIAWLLGMLHDVGRFEQLRLYNTYLDAQSIDHAMYGADILFGSENHSTDHHNVAAHDRGLIRTYIDSDVEDALLEAAIRYHSLYRLPENLDSRTKTFCQILRDADKIDILKVNVDYSLEEVLDLKSAKIKTETVSEDVMNAFFEGHAVLHSLKKTSADHIVGYISLFFELVYPESRRITISQGYIDQLLTYPSDNPKTREQFELLRQKIDSFNQEHRS